LFAGIVLLAIVAGGVAVALLYRINNWDSKTAAPGPNRESTPIESPAVARNKPGNINEPTPERIRNITGEWNLVNTIEQTSYPAYNNLIVRYHLVITQNGKQFTGEGEKVAENDAPMDSSQRTPIHVNGTVNGDTVTATFVEEGLRRTTDGDFNWTLSADSNRLNGRFSSTAAKSSGPSVASRQK